MPDRMNDRLSLVTLQQFNDPPAHDPAVMLRLQELCMDAAEREWHKAGFRSVTAVSGAGQGALFTAEEEGEPVLLALAPPAGTPMELHSLTEEQCARAESESPQHTLYYASLLLAWDELLLLPAVAVRRGGKWLTEEAESAQFLPVSLRGGGSNVVPALLGAGYYFKLFRLLVPHLVRNGHIVKFCVEGLFGDTAAEQPYCMLKVSSPPCWVMLLQHREGQENWEVVRPVFYHGSPPYSELELVSALPEYRELGLVELLNRNGQVLYAECPEAIAVPAALPCGRRYRWALSLVAERAEDNTHEFKLTDGPAVEMQRDEYRKEHGCEPPEDFCLTFSTSQMRALNQEGEGEDAAYASVLCGVITSLQEVPFSPMEVPGGSCLMATVSCLPDDEDTLVSVYLPPAVLGDYTPAVGQNILCSGMLYAVPDALCETTESWQDSAEVGEVQTEQAVSFLAYHAFHEFAPCSLGLGVAASAFVHGGWQVEQAHPEAFTRGDIQLAVSNQRGELYIVLVDTVVNGHEPVYSFEHLREMLQKSPELLPEGGAGVLYATVRLDYHAAADRYAVAMELNPACEGVENRLLYTASGFEGSIPCIGDGPLREERTRPEVLDEAMAAELFRAALAEGAWGAFAKWLREELHYTSATAAVHELHSKTDYLRYITERVEMWKDKAVWPDFSFSCGTVLHDGSRRPCMAMRYQGNITAIAVFDDAQGLIGSMHAVPTAEFSTYQEKQGV